MTDTAAPTSKVAFIVRPEKRPDDGKSVQRLVDFAFRDPLKGDAPSPFDPTAQVDTPGESKLVAALAAAGRAHVSLVAQAVPRPAALCTHGTTCGDYRGQCAFPLSTVSEHQVSGVILGHILFSPVTVRLDSDSAMKHKCTELHALGLAPLGVLPGFQRCGIGSQLIRSGLAAVRGIVQGLVSTQSLSPVETKSEPATKVAKPIVRKPVAIFILGHVEYYPRFGFKLLKTLNNGTGGKPGDTPPAGSRSEPLGLRCVYAGDHFMALELPGSEGILRDLNGVVCFSPEFDAL